MAGLVTLGALIVAGAVTANLLIRPVVGQPGAIAVSSATSTGSPAPAQPLSVTASGGPPGILTGPEQPVTGAPYPFDLYVHCGIRYATFGGHWWHAEPEQPDPHPGMAYGGNPYTRGTMTLIAPDRARFDRRNPDLAVEFRPDTTPPQPCD